MSICTRSIGGIMIRQLKKPWKLFTTFVKAGKARYIGASSMFSWQFAKALYTAELHGWNPLCFRCSLIIISSTVKKKEK